MHINGIKDRMIKTAKAEILCPAVFINPEKIVHCYYIRKYPAVFVIGKSECRYQRAVNRNFGRNLF